MASLQAARTGDEDELRRLALSEGQAGLLERAHAEGERVLVLDALAHTSGFFAMPWLVEVAEKADDDGSARAFTAMWSLANLPRTTADNEDADELRQACVHLARMASSSDVVAARRKKAATVLRQLREWGCAPTPRTD